MSVTALILRRGDTCSIVEFETVGQRCRGMGAENKRDGEAAARLKTLPRPTRSGKCTVGCIVLDKTTTGRGSRGQTMAFNGYESK